MKLTAQQIVESIIEFNNSDPIKEKIEIKINRNYSHNDVAIEIWQGEFSETEKSFIVKWKTDDIKVSERKCFDDILTLITTKMFYPHIFPK